MHAGLKDLGYLLLISQANLQEPGLEVEKTRFKLVLIWAINTAGNSLTRYAPALTPKACFADLAYCSLP